MRHPVLSAFAMMSFIGAACFAVACAKDGPEIEPITGTMPTEPADDAGETKTITIPSKDKPKKDAGAKVTPVVDASPADTGAPPPAGDDDDDDDDDDVLVADCPNDQTHMMGWTMASLMGGTTCVSHGTDCASNECCFVYPVPGLGQNYCVAQ